MRAHLIKHIDGKSVAILGFGREGRSSYNLIKKYFPEQEICILDKNPNTEISDINKDSNTTFQFGANYLEKTDNFDVIFKSPGVSIEGEGISIEPKKILTQTSLFIEKYSSRIIGITGTKGKSTTSSLIHHIFEAAGRKSVFVGNIGVPPFDAIDEIEEDSSIIFELSAHQLEQTVSSPHIAILLNVYPEHLDYFKTFDRYAEAKLKIGKLQTDGDAFIYNQSDLKFLEELMESFHGKKINLSIEDSTNAVVYLENEQVFSELMEGQHIDISERKLPGMHNVKNILAATAACLLCKIPPESIESGIKTFHALEHRLEYAGTYCGIKFINDSISTIPESTIEALLTISDVDTLILGGFDRGIDYSGLVEYIIKNPVPNVFYTGNAGIRINKMLQEKAAGDRRTIYFKSFDELGELVEKYTLPGKTCLLSPAASSYDQFNNFMERGHTFKKMAELLGKSCH